MLDFNVADDFVVSRTEGRVFASSGGGHYLSGRPPSFLRLEEDGSGVLFREEFGI